MALEVTLELINGLKVGIEHLSFEDDDEDDADSVVICDLFFLRLAFISYSSSE